MKYLTLILEERPTVEIIFSLTLWLNSEFHRSNECPLKCSTNILVILVSPCSSELTKDELYRHVAIT